jgi:RimJ/RimL family protein N-acetyltransferase
MIAADIVAERITLTALDDSHVTERYRRWMNDPRVTQYLESRYSTLSLDDLRGFVTAMRESAHSYFFAIMDRTTGEHVGNIKLGPINEHHLRAPIGVMIGEPDAWGKGIATEAVTAISGWAFTALGLRKLVAGSYADNVGSIRAFEKAGYRIEGRQVSEVIKTDGTRGDAITFGMTSEELA